MGLCSVISRICQLKITAALQIFYYMFSSFYFIFLRTSTSPIRQQFCYVSFVQFAEIAFLNVSYAKTIILLSKRAKAYINRLNLVETFLSKIIVIGRKVQIGQEKKCNPTWIFFFSISHLEFFRSIGLFFIVDAMVFEFLHFVSF